MRHYRGNVDDFEMYKLCIDQSRKTANEFNKLYKSDTNKVRFVVPAVTKIDNRSRKKFEKDESVVFEEQVKGKFSTFIDKRGNLLDRDNDCLIHSREGKFGPKDKRDPGIKDVMENHTCNKFCQRFLNKMLKFDNGSDEY